MNTLLQTKLEAIKALCFKYKVKSLYSFGSVNTPDFTGESDVDLLLEFEPNITIEEYTDNYFLLHEKLSELLARKIDMVTFRSLSNPFFIADVEQNKLLIYGT